MKTHSALFAATLIASSVLACAQSPQEKAAPEPLQTPDLFAPLPTGGTPVATPATAPATEAPVKTAAPAKSPEALKNGTAEQLRQAIQIRELKTTLLEDAEIQAWKATATSAKTEEGRRVAMRNYYTLLYSKMEKLNSDPALFPVLEGQLHDLLASYEQHNVRPSVLTEPITPLPGSRSEDHAALAGKPDASKNKELKIKSFSR